MDSLRGKSNAQRFDWGASYKQTNFISKISENKGSTIRGVQGTSSMIQYGMHVYEGHSVNRDLRRRNQFLEHKSIIFFKKKHFFIEELEYYTFIESE